MSRNIIQSKGMLLGERLIKGIELSRSDGLDVSILEATWTLKAPSGSVSTPAPAVIDGSKVSALIEPTETGTHILEFTVTLTDGQIDKTRLRFDVQ